MLLVRINLQIMSKSEERNTFDINNYDVKDINRNVLKAVDKRTNEAVDIYIYEYKNMHKYDPENKVCPIVEQGCIYNNISITQYLDFPGIVKLIDYRKPSKDDKQSDQSVTVNGRTIKITGYVSVFEHMEFLNTKELFNDFINSKGVRRSQLINPTVINKLIFGVASIMKRIHNHNVVHGNLTLDSVFLDEDLEPRIGNFDSAHFEIKRSEIQKSQFLPLLPEYHDIERKGFCIDVMQFASLIASIFYVADKNVYLCIGEDGKQPNQHIMPDAYMELIKLCTKKDLYSIPTFNEITEMLKDDKFAFELFGKKTDLKKLHEYQNRIDSEKSDFDIQKELDHYKSGLLILT